jgi:hypothetical protein
MAARDSLMARAARIQEVNRMSTVSLDLVEQARARLRELERGDDEADELGERVELQPGDYFLGRWRSDALVMRTRDGEAVPVFGLWDFDGRRRFHYKSAALVAEIDAFKPAVGDTVAIVRGQDVQFEKDGEQRRMHRYAVRVKPNSEPLPEGGAPEGDDDVPF